MSLFQRLSRALFDAAASEGAAPWEIGRAQPALVELLEECPPRAPVLDVGCGTGDLTLHLAGAGLDVLGIDFSEAAIRRARRKVEDVSIPTGSIEFEVADATHPTRLGRQFGAVVDSGFLHMLGAADRDRFLRELTLVMPAGGRYYVLALAARGRGLLPRPGLSEHRLRTWFTTERGWRLVELRPATFQLLALAKPALLACAERQPAPPS
jgi:ubiquinone/menaquinone biosynthesis C-methylase UbiE